jgi:acyl dehydratase
VIRYAEDIEVGMTVPLGSRALTAREMIDFATEWDPQDFHIDEQAAASGYFGGIIASGVLTFALYMRMAVDTVYREWAIVAGRSVKGIEYLRPVRPGMTLHGFVRVESVEPRGSDRSTVAHTGILADDDGNEVVTVSLEAVVARTPAFLEGRNLERLS